ncbi:MAG: hypothetical protein LDL19_01190 [Thiobacillus sp.]|nr:hypothetical protein [Thiobacillus sp.]
MTLPPMAALRGPLVLLVVVSIAAASGVLWSLQLDARARASLESQHAALAAAEARQRQGQHEARMIETHIQAYRALIARGFIGEENRLAWIEAVQLANRETGLYGLTYTLSPRAPAPATLAAGLPLQLTRMNVKMPLLVETDLTRFLDALQARSPGVVRVERCTLAQLANAATGLSTEPALEAECELVWYTLSSGETK